MLKFFIMISIILSASACSNSKVLVQQNKIPQSNQDDASQIILGNENFLAHYVHLLKGKRVGLLTNPSGVNHKIQNTADLFFTNPDIQLTALFSPEHGIRGAAYAGDKVRDTIDSATGLPIFSLYGAHRKPTRDMLTDVDVLVVDIQDIGVRAYTYIYTMAMVMQAAAEFEKQVIVLDRPNPLGGLKVEGNLVEEGYFSFVGLYPIPYRHGMTIGELAKLFNQEYGIHCNLTIIPMIGWSRDMLWDRTDLAWIPPSPHVPHWQTILFMSTTGTLGELRTISEGVGYTSPFELVGAPWIDGSELAKYLNNLDIPGVIFRPIYYTPYYATFKGEICQGVQIHLTNSAIYPSYQAGFQIIEALLKLYPEQDLFAQPGRVKMFNKVVGCAWIAQDLRDQIPVREIAKKWQAGLHKFMVTREKYLLYPN